MAVQIPDTIRDSMRLKGIKNLRQLAIKAGYGDAPIAVHRLFSGRNKHTSLVALKKVSEVLQWSLEQFFCIIEGNDPQCVAQFIRGRLKQLDITVYQFGYLVTGTTYSGRGNGAHHYIDGDVQYDNARIYINTRKALGITADALYESLIILQGLTPARAMVKLSSTVEEQLSQDLVAPTKDRKVA